jgi:hypothetical protein
VEVSYVEDDCGGKAFNKTWEVKVWGATEGDILDTLAHELTHVAQHVRERLYIFWDGSFEWEGQSLPADMPYKDRPCEREAWKAGHDLSVEYITMTELEATA